MDQGWGRLDVTWIMVDGIMMMSQMGNGKEGKGRRLETGWFDALYPLHCAPYTTKLYGSTAYARCTLKHACQG